MQMMRQALKDLRRHFPWEMVQTAVAVIEDQAFDWRYGVDTRGITPLADLAIDSRHVAHGVHYAPTRVRYFRAVLRALPIPRDSVFVDLGAGKGRMLLLAAQSRRFRKVVGVEFSAELCRTAERNIRRFQRHDVGNVTFEVAHADAADYEVQPDQNVFFMFNPFGPVVMQQVIQRIGHSLEERPRREGDRGGIDRVHPGQALRQSRGVRRAVRLHLQRPGELHHRPELPDRRRPLSGDLLADAEAQAELRVLRSRSAAGFAGRQDLLVRVHVLRDLRRRPAGRDLPELRR